MCKSIFSGLENLGFDNIDNVDLYNKKSNNIKNETVIQLSAEDKERNSLYEKQITCPVCGNVFKAKAIKTSSYRMVKRDSDFFIFYEPITPYFYDVWICNACGYSSMKSDFNKIRGYQIDLIKEKITPKWHSKIYPDIYDVKIAIERYKLSLLSYYVIESKPSKKAMNCLKLAWMNRLLQDNENELMFLKQALEGFNEAYFSESFPLYNMDKFTSMYLIGELNRRLGNNDEALKWFSEVVTSTNCPSKIKDLTRDQRDLVKETMDLEKKSNEQDTENFSLESDTSPKKDIKTFFSKLFK